MVERDYVSGIDVSHYQGRIDWPKVAESGVRFAFIKAMDGLVAVDGMFGTNWNAARVAKVERGAYHFFRAEQDAEQQAKLFISRLSDDWGELPPVLDFEMLGKATAEQALKAAEHWMQLVEEASGRRPILYTCSSFWRAQVNDSHSFSTYPLWIANYTTLVQPMLPSGWKQWTFWQHSEQGRVPGINGPVDLDRFCGNAMELEAWRQRISIMSATAGS